jgi:hypothetical protein
LNNMRFILCLFLFFAAGCSGEPAQTVSEKDAGGKSAQKEQAGQAAVKPAEPEIVPAVAESGTARNPFLSLDEAFQFSQRGGEMPLEGVHISAIFYSGSSNSAIVDGKILSEGDSLDGKQIVKIDRESVHLAEGKNTYVARIGDIR